MTTDIEMKERVLNLIQQLPICIPDSMKKQWTVRCPYCGDSIKSHDHGHLSILIDMDSDKPMMWRCFRCNASGIVSTKLLDDLMLPVDPGIETLLNQKVRRSYNAEKYRMLPKRFTIPTDPKNEHAPELLSYVNSRLGLGYGYESASRDGIILGFKTFLEENHIRLRDMDQITVDALNENYVGFLSSNRNRITFRTIRDPSSGFTRYYKCILDPSNRSTNTFYALPGRFDILYTDDIHVHIAEGTFDILSIRYNLPHNEPGNHIFYAVTGFNYNQVLKYLLAKGVNTNIHLHIYADKDKSLEDHKGYLDNLITNVWIDHVYIHRNLYEDEKDYGVPKERIQDSQFKLR